MIKLEYCKSEQIALRIKNISKNFGNIKALSNVSMDIKQGEVVAFVGDNGAGKSTLMKIISGNYPPSSGQIEVFGEKIKKYSPINSLNKGITTVYQNLALVDDLDIACNIFLGREPLKYKVLIDKKKMISKSEELLSSLKINITSVNSQVGELSGGQRQGIAIARSISQGGKILILDEPTAAMGLKESTEVYNIIGNLSEKNITTIIVSHNLQKIYNFVDKVCIMKQGEVLKYVDTKKTSYSEVADAITKAV